MLQYAILTSLACVFIHIVCTWPDMLLSFVGDKLTGTWTKPLFNCLTCMCSIWGTVFYFGCGGSLNFHWPLFVFAVGALNTFFCLGLEKWNEYGC